MDINASTDISELILKKSYAKAAKVLRLRLESDPRKAHLHQQLADVLLLDGKSDEAVPLLETLADDFTREGLFAKAIAVLKKIQRVDPSRSGIDAKLATLFKERDAPTDRITVVRRPPPSLDRIASHTASPSDTGQMKALPPPVEVASEEFVLEFGGATDAPAAPPPPAGGLARTPLFSDLDADELTALIGGLELASFEAGDVIVTEGEAGASLFVLSTGVVKVWVKDASGKSFLVRSMTDGDFFGEVSILTGRTRTATITAATSCELLELDRETVRSIERTHPRVSDVLMDFCQERISSAKEHEIRRHGAS